MRTLALLLCSTALLSAKPFIFYKGIVNAASYAPQGLQNGAIARGSMFSIFGRDLGPAVSPTGLIFPLETTFGGVSVEVCQQATCVAALPVFVLNTQVNAVMPSDAPLGEVSIRVAYNGEAGNFSPATVTDSSLGIFAVNSGGFGPGIVQNFVAADDQPINSMTAATKPGDVVTLWGTGLGAGLGPDNQAPPKGDLPVQVEIFVGGAPATNRLYSGRSPCCSGIDQFVFAIPSDAPLGCYVPVLLRTAGRVVSNSVTIAITADGGPCGDASSPFGAVQAGGRVGGAFLTRFYTRIFNSAKTALDYTTDFAAVVLQNEPGGPWRFNRLYSLPPVGVCTTYGAPGEYFGPELVASLAAQGTVLSAGAAAAVSGGASEAVNPRQQGAPYYFGLVGADLEVRDPVGPLVFASGASHTISLPGGADVGAFQVPLTASPQPVWTNRDQVTEIRAGAELQVTWSAVEAPIIVLGAAAQPKANASALFLCRADGTAGRLTVPGHVTAALGPPGAAAAIPGVLALGQLSPNPATFSAAGLDAGVGEFVSVAVKQLRVGKQGGGQ